MRHLFDQYTQPENRLTHALVSGLATDPKLLKGFIKWIIGDCQAKARFFIVEQALPGEIEDGEDKSEERGLPDAWIYNEDGWALLIESKISSRIETKQLKRHLRVAHKRGFLDAKLLVIATEDNLKRLPDGVIGKAWCEVYEWLIKQYSNSDWARRIATYMEIAEGKMVQSSYLKEGTLTKFAGIPFSREYQFNYVEAKRVLGLLFSELKKSKRIKKLGVDPALPGRGAIRGFNESSVWDFMRLNVSRGAKSFTKHPHLTIAIRSDNVLALVTLPHGVKPLIRNRIFGRGQTFFNKFIFAIAKNMKEVIKLDSSVKPFAKVVQRHYHNQSSPAVEDSILCYDLRTVVATNKRIAQKYQPEWLETTYNVMTSKKSNIQFEVGIEIKYDKSKIIATPKAVELFEKTFISLKPFIDIALKKAVKGRYTGR